MTHFLSSVRTVALFFLMGAATGAYGEWRYTHTISDDIQARMVEGGWCAQTDPRKVVYLFACRDAYYAQALQENDAQRAAEVTTILNSMEQTQPKAKIVRAKQ